MTESNSSNRVSCKRRQPNRLFQELLESLYREALQNHNSLVPSLKQAIHALEKYPLPLASGAECAILKGFDVSLCRYLDSQLNEQLMNKKVKVCNNEDFPPLGRTLKLKHSPTRDIPEKIPESNMTCTSMKNQRKTKKLETNVEKCPFQSKFGEPSVKNTGPGDTGSGDTIPKIDSSDCTAKSEKPNSSKTQNRSEKNNNAGKNLPLASVEKAPPVYFETETKKDCDELNEELEYDMETIDLCEYWECFTNNQLSDKDSTNIKTPSQPIELLDPSEDEDSVTKVNLTSDDESIGQASNQCLHDDESLACKQCESISTAADAFQLYFKEKTKRDAEEIGKCMLPRKMYKPAYRSGAYAILVALLEQRNECPYRDCLTKEELIQKAQKHADESFTMPKPNSNYTAWTNAKRLINKGMIQIWNFDTQNEDFYMLTAMGRAVAMELVNENTPTVTVNDIIFHGQRNDRVPSLEDVVLIPPPLQASVDEEQSSVFIEMPPGTFDIVMLIDKRENFKKILPTNPNNYCKYEERSLTIGDFLWIARSKKTGQELVLPYIMERKRMDDLASSIKDGRFHEQKFRLRKCGLNNVIYLVESYKKNGQYALPMATLMQAVVNTSVMEEFNVVKTDSLNDTFRFLGMLSETLAHRFLPIFLRGSNRDTQGKELMTFEFFNKFSCKNKPLTVRDTFVKMLLQLKGLSIEKALAITLRYTTPRNLMKAYEKCTPKEGELLLSNLKINYFSRNVGPVVSKTVYKLFCPEM